QRTPEIVEHFAAPYGRNRPVAGGASKQPRQKLPVATRPPMRTLCGHIVTGRKLFDHLDIRGQASARENTLEQVMAEQGVVRDSTGHCRFEGVDVINALAGV